MDTTNNITRLVTGFGMGLGLSTALMTLFNLTIWQGIQKEALLRSHFWPVGRIRAGGRTCWDILVTSVKSDGHF